MKVIIYSDSSVVKVVREPGDPRASNDSHFMHMVKRQLIADGIHDLIKVRMHKDGHLVDDHQQYIVTRKRTWAVLDGNYAIRSAAKDFNTRGEVFLTHINL